MTLIFNFSKLNGKSVKTTKKVNLWPDLVVGNGKKVDDIFKKIPRNVGRFEYT